jgi:hypothetical protein
MIDMQLLNDALMVIALVVLAAIAISVAVVAAAGVRQRRSRTAHVRAIEKHLAAVAERQSPAATR